VSAADLGLIVSVFLASAVEFVEALTIVLAMGVTRGWRSALAGTFAALAALVVVAGSPAMRLLRGFVRFWVDFIVGDDWRIALGVAVVLALGAVLVALEAVDEAVLAPLVAAGIVAVASFSIVSSARRERSRPLRNG